ncbi:MAG: sel1 repeat family protein [Burkholderiaceae bacterium]|nr:sel1 repeat family protein [Burkholderiaceae bacterium]
MGYLGLEEAERAITLGAYHQAFEIFMAMVESGEDPAFYKLCKMTLLGQLNDEERNFFVRRLFQDIEQGNGVAAFNAGVLYSRGIGFPLNLSKAVDMFNQAIANNVTEGYLALAKLYMLNREQIPLASTENIVSLLERGAKAGSVDCAFTLGKHYTQGDFLQRNIPEAFKFLYLAALQGHEEAKRSLMVIQALHPKDPFEQEQRAAKEMLYRIQNPYDHPDHGEDFIGR